MDYMDLTDEEILLAIKKAREISSAKGTQLSLSIQAAMEVILEEKRKNAVKESTQVLEESKNEKTINIDSNKFIRNNFETSFSLQKRADEMIRNKAKKDSSTTLYQQFWYAVKGKLTPEYFKRNPNVFSGFEEPDKSEFAEIINTINNLARESYYAYYATASDEEIEKARLNTIALYKQAKEKGIEARSYLESNKLWNHEAATIKIEEEVSQFDYGDNILHQVGIDSFISNDQLEAGTISYPPQSYDNTYYVINAFLNSQGDFHNKRIFNEADALVDQTIAKLEKMSAEEFRNYKISLMKLIPGERQMIETNMTEYVKTNDEEKGNQTR